MGRCIIFTALVAVLALPALARADVPGGPPAVPPDCPPGTRLEGPYRYWRCVPVAPSDPSVPAVDDPAPAPEPPVAPASPPVEAQAAPPASPGAAASGCAVGSGSSAGAAWMLVALVAARCWRRRSARSAQRHSGGTA